MQQNPVSFVTLQFSRSPDEAVGLLVLDFKNGGPLQVWAQSGWQKQVDAEDRAYLSALMGEWAATPVAEIPALMDELSRQSHGPLLALRRGDALEAECRSLLDGFVRQVP